ncbi:squalene synthase HpnC [Methylotenera mobilis]|uniref:Squalene synthase HpnC n=1 Tax=Methylotenera mobilis (strain JLW8 / ATCC BAA-1282 / DSM 17540) TaxID=583345 RepID=C6WVY3_METML|nr:squalene synthase HpnC [Methylotenera mobilis]ACT48082.1 squalene synthase HpnC [Methylotenera mobilis JLW8]
MSVAVAQQSLDLASRHYENFPVASCFLPESLREPIALIYSFARQADDFADEGDLTIEQRLNLITGFRDELDLLQAYIKPQSAFFMTLGQMIRERKLPLVPFYDLLDAFSQDVTKTRYADYEDVLDYCARSANPIGSLLLHLYHQATPENITYSNHICSALQLINFLQDIAIDFKKNEGKQRIYLCQDEMAAFGITEQTIGAYVHAKQPIDDYWQQFMHFNLRRVHALLNSGKPLGKILRGRIGFEMRMVIAGGERIIHKISAVNGDVFNRRPKLNYWDWAIVFSKALLKL